MPDLHGRCRTVCPNTRKLNSNLIIPLNFLNWANGSQIELFLNVTSEPSVPPPTLGSDVTLKNALIWELFARLKKFKIWLEFNFLLFGQTVRHLPCKPGIKQIN